MKLTANHSFFISCVPPKKTAQAGKRAGIVRGKAMIFTTKEAQETKNLLASLLLPHKPESPYEGALGLKVTYTWPWRKSEPKKNRVTGSMWMPVRPDIDNLVKQLLDTMTGVGFWNDDGQIVQLVIGKKWGDIPGMKFVIAPADGGER